MREIAVSVEVCKKCRRLFNYPGFGVKYCQTCRKADEEVFSKIKDFLNEHGNATKYEIAEATGVSPVDVEQYLRDGRLEIPEGSDIYIKCEVCGCDIRSGRYCPVCAGKMAADLKASLNIGAVGDKPRSSGKMRFIESKKG